MAKRKKTHDNRAYDMLEAMGWTVDHCERRITSRVKKDLFGFADLIGVNPADYLGTLVVQVTSPTNVAARVKKLLAEPRVKTCLHCGWRVEVWGVRDKPDRHGSLLLARTFALSDSGRIRIIEGSNVMETFTLEGE